MFVSLGNDQLSGDEGSDVMVGDNLALVVP